MWRKRFSLHIKGTAKSQSRKRNENSEKSTRLRPYLLASPRRVVSFWAAFSSTGGCAALPSNKLVTTRRTMADLNASDVLVETIYDWGIDTIFGIPGDGINGVIEALRKRRDKIRFIHVRHEESAAFMACAYAKFTGKIGCCLATSGPGGIHLLNGLYDAKLDGQSVLAITGMQFHDLIGTQTQQDVELDKLFMDACVYNTRCMGPEHMENIAELACRTALAYRGVSHLCIPVDFQEAEVANGNGRSARNISGHVSEVSAHSARIP